MTPQGKLPVLWNYDGLGHDLGQEQAVTRFLAQKVGLAGRTDGERWAADSLYCQLFATLRNNGVSHDGEHYSVAALKAYEGNARSVPPYEQIFRRNSFSRAERSIAAL